MENENKLIPISTNNMVQKVSTSIAITNKLITENNKQLVREIFQRNRRLFQEYVWLNKIHLLDDIYFNTREKIDDFASKNVAFFNAILLPNHIEKPLRDNKNGVQYRIVEVELQYPDGSKEIIEAKLFEPFRLHFNLEDYENIKLGVKIVGENEGEAIIGIKKPGERFVTNVFKRDYTFEDSELEKEYLNISSQDQKFISEFLVQNYKFINWDRISEENINWSEKLIIEFLNDWNWESLSQNESLPWSEKFIEKHENKWDYEYGLSYNKKINWSIKLIHKYSEKLSSSENIWNTLKPYVDDEMVFELLEEIKTKGK